MKTIAELQKAAYALAKANGEYKQPCPICKGKGGLTPVPSEQGGGVMACSKCWGDGHMPVDPRSPTRIAARLERIHRAIGDAGECVEKGSMKLYFTHGGGPVGSLDAIRKAHVRADGETVLVSLTPKDRSQYEPKGFPIALATVFLGLCELAESLGVELIYEPETLPANPDMSVDGCLARLNDLHEDVPLRESLDTELAVTGRYDMSNLLSRLAMVARIHEIDLHAMAELKLEHKRGRR